ncbi:MAG: amidase domain-containing protein [Eubacterium sp.]|jgi:hypothetical protein|nr:amidase domain-containing protein [Eubacterium sp.]
MTYDRQKTVEYARRWAYGRNPDYYIFDDMGGDCTNFASQSIYAGAGVMNFDPDDGWYYLSLNQRSPSWAGVEFLMKFLTENRGPGPYAVVSPLEDAEPGDIIFLSFSGKRFEHSTIVISNNNGDIRIAAHTYDNFNRPLSTYEYSDSRLLHIEGVNP